MLIEIIQLKRRLDDWKERKKIINSKSKALYIGERIACNTQVKWLALEAGTVHLLLQWGRQSIRLQKQGRS